MASLWLLDENGLKAQAWDVGEQPMAIGRDDSSDVIVKDDALSRRHFLVVRSGGAFEVQDLESQNGTWVDGRRAGKVPLRHHNCILAGRSLFLFHDPMTAGPSAELPKPGVP